MEGVLSAAAVAGVAEQHPAAPRQQQTTTNGVGGSGDSASGGSSRKQSGDDSHHAAPAGIKILNNKEEISPALPRAQKSYKAGGELILEDPASAADAAAAAAKKLAAAAAAGAPDPKQELNSFAMGSLGSDNPRDTDKAELVVLNEKTPTRPEEPPGVECIAGPASRKSPPPDGPHKNVQYHSAPAADPKESHSADAADEAPTACWPLLFERASPNWYHPQFDSTILEAQYWKSSLPRTTRRFQFGLVYVLVLALMLAFYFPSMKTPHWPTFLGKIKKKLCFLCKVTLIKD